MNRKVAPEEAAGRLFMVGLPGPVLDDSTRELIRDWAVGNFIIFRRNVVGPDQLRCLCGELSRYCRDQGLGPPLISIDQEGGSVARLPPPFTQFPGARTLAGSADPEAALGEYAAVCGRELGGMGINMNLAPVLDVSPAGEGLFMEHRSFGGAPDRVAELGCLVIRATQEAGIAACAKHFPGLGAATLDPHYHLPRVERDAAALRAIDLVPFQRAMAAGVAAVMSSHTIYPAFDPDTPATLSGKIFTGLLRRELGFDGLVITDDLEMGAIENDGRVADAAVRAFLAGCDLLLVCHDHDKVRLAIKAIREAIRGGALPGGRLSEALERLDRVRRRYAGSG